jgi:threonine/homoserine/homoserine lactone efflux protein
MPELSTLILFASTSVLLLVVPGPTVILVMTRALSNGAMAALPLVLGTALGSIVAASLAMMGAGALLAASATAFMVLKLAGAAWLIWMGLKLIRSAPQPLTSDPERGSYPWGQALRDGFLVQVTNPKAILFFVAFVPQFIQPQHSYGAQSAVLIAVFVGLNVLVDAGYVFGAGLMRKGLRRPKVLCWINRAGGSAIIAAGLATLLARRPAV